VVYFSQDAAFRKPDLKVRVGIKEREDPISLCYCFGYTRADVRRDLEALGSTDIPDRIKAEIQPGFLCLRSQESIGDLLLGRHCQRYQGNGGSGNFPTMMWAYVLVWESLKRSPKLGPDSRNLIVDSRS